MASRPGLALPFVLACTTACAESVRVPLAVPFPVVGGARPAHPQGLQLLLAFGDGVWGQEQERAEMAGGGFGFSLADRVEAHYAAYQSTRTVRDSYGNDHAGEATRGLRAKVRAADFLGGRAALGVQVSRTSGRRRDDPVQDDRVAAFDAAFPLEIYPRSGPLPDHRLGLYAAPRIVVESFENRTAGLEGSGTLLAAVVGVAFRTRYVGLALEANVARTPGMRLGAWSVGPGWIFLPMAALQGTVPLPR